jgi:ribosomal-protein-alanine N-acetyltransferase
MSLSPALEARFEALTENQIEAWLAIEKSAYSHPWTRMNFLDSIRSGYNCQGLWGGDELIGYFVAMLGVEETHLLNLTVAPSHQGQGWAKLMLEALALWSRGKGAHWLWLEVRASNARALSVYAAHGFRRVGDRKNYYPLATGKREDAIVMSLPL